MLGATSPLEKETGAQYLHMFSAGGLQVYQKSTRPRVY